MNILLTGSEGFIGTHVRARLSDHEVTRVDCLEPRVHQNKTSSPVGWPYKAGQFIRSAFVRNFDSVVHLAAQVGVADSMEDPWRYVNDNTSDTLYLLEGLRKWPPKRLVVASSMSIYGDPQTSSPISEDAPIRTASVYGLTKFDQERLCLMYGEMLGFEVVALRFFNVYGPGQALHNPYTGVLAIFSNALLRGEAPTIYEDGLQMRDFVYVDDVADVVVAAAEGRLPGGVYNVCTGRAVTVLNVAETLARELNVNLAPTITGTKRPGDIRHCIGDPSKLRRAFPEWKPRPFSEGIKTYASYLLKNQESKDPPTSHP